MADTPVFESEKLLKKQRKKRILLIVVLGVVILLAAASAALLAGRCSGRTHTGGEELPFTYTWREAADGSAAITVSTEGEEALSWRVTDPGDSFGCVGIEPSGSGKGGSSFKLTPIKEGRSAAVITLGGDGADKYAMELLTEAYADGPKLRCRVLNASCRRVQTEMRAEGDVSYHIYTDADGDTVIEVESGCTDWECISSNEAAAAVIGVINGDGCVKAYIRSGGEPGEAEVTLESAADGKKLTAAFTLGSDGGLICSNVLASAEPTAEPTAEAEPGYTPVPGGEATAEPTSNP